MTYDVAFLSAVAHNAKGADVTLKKERCIAHPIIKKPMANRDELTAVCAAANVVLAYYKVKDDIIDSGKGRMKLAFLSRAFKRANAKYPKLSKIVETRYEELRRLEVNRETSIDRASDPFAQMLKEIGEFVLGEEVIGGDRFFYYLGKWIYLIDALDDYEKDIKSGSYNPFYYSYGKKRTKKELLGENGKDVSFVFAEIFSSLTEANREIKWKFNHDLIDNIINKGIPSATMKVIKGNNSRKKRDKVEITEA